MCHSCLILILLHFYWQKMLYFIIIINLMIQVKMEGDNYLEPHIRKMVKEEILKDSMKIKQKFDAKLRQQAQDNLKALLQEKQADELLSFDFYKAAAEAGKTALKQFKQEFKDQRWKVTGHFVVKEEKKKIWEASEQYKKQQKIKYIVEEHRLKKIHKAQQQEKKKIAEEKKKEEPKIEVFDPLSGVSQDSSNVPNNQSNGFKMTTSEMVGSNNSQTSSALFSGSMQSTLQNQNLQPGGGFPITSSDVVQSKSGPPSNLGSGSLEKSNPIEQNKGNSNVFGSNFSFGGKFVSKDNADASSKPEEQQGLAAQVPQTLNKVDKSALFGNSVNPTQTPFGNSQPSSLFANINPNANQKQSSPLFGQNVAQNTDEKPSLIGNSQTVQPKPLPTYGQSNIFNSGPLSFGTNIFGASGQQTDPTKTSIFGFSSTDDKKGKSIFQNSGQPKQEQGGSIFGNVVVGKTAESGNSSVQGSLFGRPSLFDKK